MRERGGRTKAIKLANTDMQTIQDVIVQHVEIGSTLHTDEHGAYQKRESAMARRLKIPSGIGAKLRRQILCQGYSLRQASDLMQVSNGSLYETVNEYIMLTPTIAARLWRVGVDGRVLYLEQAANRLAKYEAVEAKEREVTERLNEGCTND